MNNSAYRRKNEAREALTREKNNTRLISDQFPKVAGIVVRIRYMSKGHRALKRTLNFHPESHAFFKMTCLGEGCDSGGLNLTRTITSMITNHHKSAKGEVHCINNEPSAGHADMAYNISIKYV